jgi:integrase/recombinase XerD
MTPHEKRPCHLTVRLADDMRIRHLAHRTIDAYTYHAERFADFIQKPLDLATVEDVRNFQLYLIDEKKLAYSSFNQAVCALRFLYTHTIRVPWPVTMVPFGKRPKTLPVVLGRQEVDELLRCTKNLKQRIFLTTLYATGMRFSEAANLRLTDLDSQRMQIRITHGKGAKQRQVPLSPRLLSELRSYWRQYRPTSLLFPGKTQESTYADTSIQKAIKVSAELAGIKKNVTPHTLRHSYATGLLEAGVDLLTISRLLGHASFATTMIYLHCRREHLHSAPSPPDWQPVRQLPT